MKKKIKIRRDLAGCGRRERERSLVLETSLEDPSSRYDAAVPVIFDNRSEGRKRTIFGYEINLPYAPRFFFFILEATEPK